MRLREFGDALIVALISVGLMVGALSISLVEFAPQVTATAIDNLLPSPAPLTATLTLPPTLTLLSMSRMVVENWLLSMLLMLRL